MKLNKGLNLDTVPANMEEGTYSYGKNMILNDEFGTVINEPGFSSLSILPADHKFCGYITLAGNKYIVFTHDDSSETLSEGTQRPGYVDSFTYKGDNYSIIYFTPGSDVVSGETLSEGIYKIKYNSTEYNVLEKGARTRILGSGESRQYNYVIFDKAGAAPTSSSIIEMDPTGGVDYIGFIENDSYTAISTTIDFLFHPRFPVTGEYRYTNSKDVEAVFRDGLNKPRKITFNQQDGIIENNLDKTYLFRELQMPIYNLEEVTGGGDLKEGAYYFTIRYTYKDGGYTEAFPLSNPVYVNSEKLRPEGEIVNSGKRIRMKISNLDQNFEAFELIVAAKVDGIINPFIVNEFNINSTEEFVTFTGNENLADISIEEVLVSVAAYDDVQTFTSLNGRLHGANVATAEGGDLQSRANDIVIKWALKNVKDYEGNTGNTDADAYQESTTAFYRKGFRPGEIYALYGCWIKNGRLTRAYHIPGRLSGNVTIKTDNGTDVQVDETLTHKAIQNYIAATYPGETADYLDDDMAIIEGGDHVDTGVRYYQTRDTSNPANIDTIPVDKRGEMCFWENEDEQYPDNFQTFGGENVRHHKLPTDRWLKENVGASYSNNEEIIHIYGNNIDITGYDGFMLFYAKPEHTILGEAVLHTQDAFNEYTYPAGTNPWDVSDFTVAAGREFRYHDPGMLFDKPPLTGTHFQFTFKSNINTPDVYLQTEFPKITISGYKDIVRPIDRTVGLRYIPNNNAAADNDWREEHIAGTLASDFVTGTDHYIGLLSKHVRNVYTSYKSQVLISTGQVTTNTEIFAYGGDTYLNDIKQWLKKGSDAKYAPAAVKVFGYFSRYNFAWRHYGTNWWEDPWILPKNISDEMVGTETKISLVHTKTIQYTDYNKDFSSLQDLTSVPIYNHKPIIRKHGSRIIRSVKQSNESPISSWRTFLPADYYELEKNTGDIVKLESYKTELVIRTENAMFITRGNAQMQTDAVAVTLGTGDIFEFEPINIIEGFGGIDNFYNSLATKVGLFSVDVHNQKIFLYTGELKEISTGIRTFLRDQDLTNTQMAYDDYYNRFIISNGIFTLSYSLWTNSWAFFHVYSPQWMFGNLSLYSIINDNDMWLHNDGPYGSYYGTIYPSFIDSVFNVMPNDTKVLANIEYIDEVWGANAKRKHNSMTHISIRNNTQHTGLIPVTPKEEFLETGNLEKEKDNWIFREFTDKVDDSSSPIVESIYADYDVIDSNLTDKAWYEHEDLSDKFSIVRFYNDNQSGDQWKLIEVGANFLRPE